MRPFAHRYPRLIAAAVLLAAIALVFGQVAGFEFITFDDPYYVAENPKILQGLTARSALWAFTTQYIGLWHPLAWISHMLDASLWGRWAGGHHLSSVLVHAGAAFLLFLFWFETSGRFWPALAIALLFAIHPTRAESVAWVSERKDVLCAFFMIATLLAWSRWRRNGRATTYGAALALYALALLAKPMAVTLPLLLMLVDRWPLRVAFAERASWAESLWDALKPVLPFALLTIPVVAVTLWPAAPTGFEPLPAESQALPRTQGLSIALAAAGVYLWQLVWPVSLSFFHPLDPSATPMQAFAGGFALAALGVAAYWWRSERPWIAFGLVWFVVALLPVSGFVRIGDYAYAERYTYLPLVGPFAAIVFTCAERARAATAPWAIAGGIAFAAVAGLGFWQVSHWRDSGTLSARALAIDPGNFQARLMQAEWLTPRDPQRAIELWRHMPVSRSPIARSQIMLHLGEAHYALGEVDTAQTWWARAIEVYPNQWRALSRAGSAKLDAGRAQEAAILLARALRIYSYDTQTLLRYGLAVERLGEPALALRTFRRAVELDPDLVEARRNAERLERK